jgi:hypothetical protein
MVQDAIRHWLTRQPIPGQEIDLTHVIWSIFDKYGYIDSNIRITLEGGIHQNQSLEG